jgi:putative transposase
MGKKKIAATWTVKDRVAMVSPEDKLSLRQQCSLLGISRSSYYYEPAAESEENLLVMKLMDRRHFHYPTHGVLQIQDYLSSEGLSVNVKRIRRLLRLMGVMAVYPKRNLSKLGYAKYKRPYLLRGLEITRKNQVWQIDITYIAMEKGFMYLVAIVDVYSRYCVGWGIYNNLDAGNCLEVLKKSIAQHMRPEIINSDQGSQFTSGIWTQYIEIELENKIRISMDGKGRATGNIYIERFWRTIKQDYIYICLPRNGTELFQGIKEYVDFYNSKKKHQGVGRVEPAKLYLNDQ